MAGSRHWKLGSSKLRPVDVVSGELERNPSTPPPASMPAPVKKIGKDRPQDASHGSMCLLMLVTEKGNTPRALSAPSSNQLSPPRSRGNPVSWPLMVGQLHH